MKKTTKITIKTKAKKEQSLQILEDGAENTAIQKSGMTLHQICTSKLPASIQQPLMLVVF